MDMPLSNITVLDASRILSGPFCTMLLADLGARVLKVEKPWRGDIARNIGPDVGDDSAYFVSVNRGKKSLAIDIFTQSGQDLFRRLSKQVDVVVENYIPGTMANLGLDYKKLKMGNPGLIYASISGFGQNGPYARRPALDIIVQAMGGMMSLTGEPNGPPERPGASLGDSTAGLFAALGIMAAIEQRHRTGKGQYIDVAMLDCQVTMMENAFSRYFSTGQEPKRIGSRHPAASPFQAFATSDSHIVVALLSDDLDVWKRFCTAIGLTDLIEDTRFSDNTSRVLNHDLLEPKLVALFKTESSDDWLGKLDAANIPCGPVSSLSQVAQNPQLEHRDMLTTIPHRKLGSWPIANTPFKLSGSRTGPQGSAPELGEHTDSILREMLGLKNEDLESLRGIDTIR